MGNIDFTPYYYWVENGTLTHKPAKHHEAGDGDVPEGALLLRRSNLNDNDAGGRVQYANFAKSTQMLEKLHHIDAGVYRKLMALNSDLKSQGPIWQWTSTSFGLDDRQISQIVKNTALASGILRDTCENGGLIFDLSPKKFFETGLSDAETVLCDGS